MLGAKTFEKFVKNFRINSGTFLIRIVAGDK